MSTNNEYNPVTGNDEGVILTDDREFALQNCGELVQAEIAASNIVELGEIIGLDQINKPDLKTRQQIERINQFVSELRYLQKYRSKAHGSCGKPSNLRYIQ